MRARAFIFDCDGTLVDSETLGTQVLLEVAAEFGARLPWAQAVERAVERFRGRKMADCARELEALCGVPLPESFVPEVRARMQRAFRQRLCAMPGAHGLLSAMGLPFCVASNGPRDKMVLSLEVTGLFGLVGDRLVSAYEVGVWKPDPGLFEHAARGMGVAAAHCAVVEDSAAGIQAGLSAGMRVFALGDTGGALLDDERVVRIASLTELHDHVGD